MSAPIGRIQVGPGQIVDSDWGNTVFDQSVQTFASAADRTGQWPAPHVGAMSYLQDTNTLQVKMPAGWQSVTDATSSEVERFMAGTQNVGTGSWAGIGMTTTPYSAGTALTATGNGILVNVAGRYRVWAWATITGNVNGARRAISVGPAAPAVTAAQDMRPPAGANQMSMVFAATITAAAAAMLQVYLYQDSGVTLVASSVGMIIARAAQ